ncbi:dipeptide ABC transporter ATP-binding protein [Pseudonocardia halophobica]|uniref:ABC transporter ATP-binding protein n=1 Tax=Pseudonocardia halophobica TaxID=29401 RepID=A0A9W6L5S3_9PSEU|nr:oligopeptide/dipeptide ABC transporter ATP-binding protein [Pseudonocardia halophobica]GLL12739.1 ABC transporter ATP-binding protein [Pseudonocardia halophobica]
MTAQSLPGRADPLLTVRDLEVTFAPRKRLFRERIELKAVDGVSFDLTEGETLGLVGESGCGKSTTARGLMRLVEPTGGSVRLEGRELLGLPAKELRSARRDIQMVFQDPYSSLDPSMLVRDSIGEPLDVHVKLGRTERVERVAELLRRVGLPPEYMTRYPHEFSGGQRQRLTIARAIAADPKILVLDEAVSALDVSTQNQVIGLLEELSAEIGLTYLFIAHDLSVVRHISHRVAVMYLGQIVEHGDAARVFDAPAHPYTEALLSAVPVPSPRTQRSRERIVLSGDPPDPSRVPPGCRFHTRCTYAMDVCRTEVPPLTPAQGSGEVACHLHTAGPRLAGASVRTLARVSA